MNSDAKDELKGILAAYQERLVGSRNRENKMKTDQVAFTELFRDLKTKIIVPVFEDFAGQLNEYGHVASIIDQEDPSHTLGSFSPANIALRIAPTWDKSDSTHASSGPIEVKYSANQTEMNVLVSSSHNPRGSSGKRGEYKTAELTEEFVVNSVLITIREAFGRAR
jgi:hypothetical protein